MVAQRRYTPAYDALPESLCNLLLQHKLDSAVLVQPSFLGCDNSYMLRTLSDYAGQEKLTLKGVVVLDPCEKPDREMFAAMDALGVIGVRLNLVRQWHTFDYNTWKKLLSDVEDRGWHIELHCEAIGLAHLLPVLVRNHSNVVIDHLGLVTNTKTCPGLGAILDQPAERLWIKNSAPYRLNFSGNNAALHDHVAELHRLFQNHVGADRILWGSDWPFTQFEHTCNYKDMISFNHCTRSTRSTLPG